MTRPLLLHVGYHKTATTWLQSVLFTPGQGFHEVLDHAAVFDRLIAPHGLDFAPADPAERIAAAQKAAPAGARVDVISLESLSGLPFAGGRESDAYARRLRAVADLIDAPRITVLIGVREQCALLASVYMQYLYRAGTQPPRRFFEERPFRGYFGFSAQTFCYDRLVGLYQELFGARNVLVLPQELIARDQQAAVRLIGTACGHDDLARAAWQPRTARMPSYPQYAVPLLRRVNHLRREACNPAPMIDLGRLGTLGYRGAGWLARKAPLPRAVASARPVTAHVRARFGGRFADSNRRLAEMLHHEVALPGYQGLGS